MMEILMLSIIFLNGNGGPIAVGVDRQALEREAETNATEYGLSQPVFGEVERGGFSETPLYHHALGCDCYYMITLIPWCGPDSADQTRRFLADELTTLLLDTPGVD